MTYREDPGRRVDPQTGDDIWDKPPGVQTPIYTGGDTTYGGSGGKAGQPTPGGSVNDPNGDRKDYNQGDPAARFNGLGGKPEVWKDTTTGQTFIVYFAPGTEPPIPLLYEVSGTTDQEGNEHTLEAFFGVGVDVVFDRELDTEAMNSTGAVRFGTTNNLVASEGDPWVGFKDRIDRAAKVSPWMNDDEMLALIGGAYLEDRELEEWEIDGTNWSQTHNEDEKKWLKLSLSDPATAASQIRQDKTYIASLFDAIGADGTSAEIIDWISNKFTTGAWTKLDAVTQIEAVTSGWTEVDSELAAFIDSGGFDTPTSNSENERVRSLYAEWLGPAYPPSEADIASWSSKIRNSDDGVDELVNMLRGQRMSLYPEYENPELTYDQIAGPWRNLAANVWGETIDETSDVFQSIIRANDYGVATKTLRQEGLTQNKTKVWQDATRAFRSDQSTSVRRAI